MSPRRRTSRLLGPLALVLAAALALLPSAAFAGQDAHTTVEVNGTTKAHGWFFASNNSFCVELRNAPKGGWAYSQVYVTNGPVFTRVEDHVPDGNRVCADFSGYDGRSGKLVVVFADAAGHVYSNSVPISI